MVAGNLAANREYDGPVVCTEPYFMNNRVVYQRLLAGDYDGTKNFNGKPYTSIFREYADCVAQGLVKAYSNSTVIAGASNVEQLNELLSATELRLDPQSIALLDRASA